MQRGKCRNNKLSILERGAQLLLLVMFIGMAVPNGAMGQNFRDWRLRYQAPETMSACDRAAYWREKAYHLTFSHPDSAVAMLSTAITAAEKANCRRELGQLRYVLGRVFAYALEKPDTAIQLLRAAVPDLRAYQDSTRLQYLHGILGSSYRVLDQHAMALHNSRICLTYAKALKDSKSIAATYNDFGILYEKEGRYPEAIEAYTAALAINKRMGNKLWASFNVGNLAYSYMELKKYEKAVFYLTQSLKMAEELEKWRRVTSLQADLAYTYGFMEAYGKADSLMALAVDSAIAWNDHTLLVTVYNVFGALATLQEHHQEAITQYKKALKHLEHLTMPEWRYNILSNIGDGYLELEQYNQAISYLKESLEGHLNGNVYQNIHTTFKNLASAYHKAGRNQEALATQQQYEALLGELRERSNRQALAAVEAKYESNTRDFRRELVSAAQLRNQSSVAKRQLLYVGGLLAGLVLLLLALRETSARKRWYMALYFLTGLTLVEFIFVVLDPYINELTSGMPALVLLVNFSIVLGLLSLYQRIRPRLEG